MSPSTAPASIDVSCPGSPTRMSRASGRTASTSRAISESETIDVSSTIDDVVREPVAAVVAEAAVAARAASRAAGAASSRSSAEQLVADGRVDVERARLLVHRLLQAGGRLAGRRGERDERGGGAGGRGLLGQQRDDPRDGGRLARAGPAGDDREAAQHGRRGGAALARVVGSRAQAARARRRAGRRGRPRAARRRARAGRRRAGAPRASSGRGRGACRRAAAGARPIRRPRRPRRAGSPRSPAAQSSGGGQGSAARSTGSSASTVGRVADRREVDVDVARAAGRARRARRRARRRGPRRRRAPPSRRATWTSAAASTPASLNARSRPGRMPRAADVERVGERRVRLDHAAPLAVERGAQRGHERARRPPGEDAARRAVDGRRAGAGHPAQEQVEDARQVAVGVVARQPPAQVAVQRDGVEQRLQPVVGALHLGRAARAGRWCQAVSSSPGPAQPVRLVVDDREPVAERERRGRCCRSGSRARSAPQRGVVEPVGVAGERVAGRQVRAQHRGDRVQRQPPGRRVAAGERQLEVELVEPVGARARRAAGGRRAAGRAASRSRPAARPRPRPSSPMSRCRRACVRATCAASSALEVGARRSRSPRAPGARRCRRARRPASRPAATGRARSAASPVARRGGGQRRRAAARPSTTSSSGSLATRGLVRAGGDVAVGRAAPAPVEPRSKRAAAARRARGRRSHQRQRQPEHPRARPDAAGRGLLRERLEARDRGRRRVGVARPSAATLPVGVAREQQPAERRVAAVARARPPHDRLVLRPGQRDVGEPQVLAALLGEVLLARGAGSPGPSRPTSIVRASSGVGVVEGDRDAGRARSPGRLPQVRAVDDRELEALAAVDGEHLDGLGVGLEPPAALLVARVLLGLGDPAPQPRRQRRRRPCCSVGRRGVQELADVAQVGQRALAVGGPPARAPAAPRRA